jgi:hypothetical protein
MPKYRVRSGTHRREDGSRAEEGEVVELTEEERARYGSDLFDKVEDETTVSETQEDETNVSEDNGEPEVEEVETEASGDIPEEYDRLRKMAKHYPGDEVNGSSSKEDIIAFFAEFSDTEIAELKEKVRRELVEE